MKKKTHTKRTSSSPKGRHELHTTVRPISAAHYWTGLIGQIVAYLPKTKLYRVEFRHQADGTPLRKAEVMDFPYERLKVVKDFSARVRKHEAPKEKANSEAEYEEFVPTNPWEEPDFIKWFEKSTVRKSDGTPLAVYVAYDPATEQVQKVKDVYVACTDEKLVKAWIKKQKHSEEWITVRCALLSESHSRIVVGGMFTFDSIEPKWLSDAAKDGHSALSLLRPVEDIHFFAFEEEEQLRQI